MAKKISSDQLTLSFIYLLVCGAGIVVFVFFSILPKQETLAVLDKEIEKANARQSEQEILTSVFDSLMKRIKIAGPSGLPSPEKAKLTRGDMKAISDRLQKIARRHDLKLEEITTDVSSLMEGSGYLMMRLRLSGDFLKFRELLIDLGKIPSLEHIEEIKIRSVKASREIKLKIWLAQE